MFQLEDPPRIRIGADAELDRVTAGESIEGVKLEENETGLFVLDCLTTLLGVDRLPESTFEEYTKESGRLVVTSSRLVFAASSGLDKDLSVDAGLITLHAIGSESSMYCQLDLPEKSGTFEISTPMELYLYPIVKNGLDEKLSQLFDALSTMAELNPDEIEDDDEGEDFESGGFYYAEDFVNTSNDEGGATEEERIAMLEKLDAVLEVPPELELNEEGERIYDSQFADADEEELELNEEERRYNDNSNMINQSAEGKEKGEIDQHHGQFDDPSENDSDLI